MLGGAAIVGALLVGHTLFFDHGRDEIAATGTTSTNVVTTSDPAAASTTTTVAGGDATNTPAAPAATAPAATTPTTEPDTLGALGNDTPIDPNSDPLPAPPSGTVTLLDVFTENDVTFATVMVDADSYNVSAGDTFAANYRLDAINGRCRAAPPRQQRLRALRRRLHANLIAALVPTVGTDGGTAALTRYIGARRPSLRNSFLAIPSSGETGEVARWRAGPHLSFLGAPLLDRGGVARSRPGGHRRRTPCRTPDPARGHRRRTRPPPARVRARPADALRTGRDRVPRRRPARAHARLARRDPRA